MKHLKKVPVNPFLYGEMFCRIGVENIWEKIIRPQHLDMWGMISNASLIIYRGECREQSFFRTFERVFFEHCCKFFIKWSFSFINSHMGLYM